MVLTHDFWMKRFGGDSSIVGKQCSSTAASVTVIGVLQPAPYFPDRMDALINMVVSQHHLSALMVAGPHASHDRDGRAARARRHARAGARPKWRRCTTRDAGRSQGRVRRRLALSRRRHPVQGSARRARATDAVAAHGRRRVRADHLRRERRRTSRSCAACGASTSWSCARRSAPAWRGCAGLLLVENLLLTLHGRGARRRHRVRRRAAAHVARRTRIRRARTRSGSTAPCSGFTLALSVALALLLSFVASLPKEGTFASWIAAGARRMSGGVRRQRLQRGLVVAQVAVSVVLLAGAGLLTRTMMQLSRGGHRPRDRAGADDSGAAAVDRRAASSARMAAGRRGGQGALRSDARARSARCRASSRSASAPPCRSDAAMSSSRSRPRGRPLAGGRGDAARRSPHRRPRVLPRRRHSADQGTRVRRDRSARAPAAS